MNFEPCRQVVTGKITILVAGKVLDSNVEEIQKITGSRMLKSYLEIPAVISVKEFAEKTGVNAAKIIGELMKNGILANINQQIDFDTAAIISADLDIKIKKIRDEASVEDLIEGNVLQPLKITGLKQDSFNNYMKSQGKLGGQNKVPRLSYNRKIADKLLGL